MCTARMVESNPVVDKSRKPALAAREAEWRLVVALGGGSVMDCGKAVAMMATNPGDFWDYVPQGTGGRKRIEIAPLPIMAISTTAGTGSEVDGGGVISNPEPKKSASAAIPASARARRGGSRAHALSAAQAHGLSGI